MHSEGPTCKRACVPLAPVLRRLLAHVGEGAARGERAGGPFCHNLRPETAPVAVPQVAQLLAVGLAHEHVEGGGAAGAG